MKKLSPEEERIIAHKGTEKPFSGEYWDSFRAGIYFCKRCGAPLYWSKDKFKSDCGWPSFDEEINGAVKRKKDADGMRTEIMCSRCGAHLGHVFTGEKLTSKNTRHCVNSISMEFVPEEKMNVQTMVLGGGCFWCVESAFLLVDGVIEVTSGYAGGKTKNPAYNEVCSGKTGHAEVVKLAYDAKKVSLEKLLKIFFKIHDPTSPNKQGNDVGNQYRSAIFYTEDSQKKEIEEFVKNAQKEYEKPIVTEVRKLGEFYKAEEYHQRYFEKNPLHPYCLLAIPPKIRKVKEILGKEK
ncbi:Peptide methionine sulfoxide reductase MsrB [Candidatus Gugararchaeum adminiculabundum]|nr:Peptide methionine sulfoxide reductase MsrB [Candidatus Gugararchaeum adminiculabundum]